MAQDDWGIQAGEQNTLLHQLQAKPPSNSRPLKKFGGICRVVPTPKNPTKRCLSKKDSLHHTCIIAGWATDLPGWW